MTLATELERRVVELRHLDDVVGGTDLSPVVAAELVRIPARRPQRSQVIVERGT